MPDVARVAGVSIKTVSRVINNEPAVRSETAERVLAAVAELGFRRNDVARNLRSGRATSSIGLVIGDLGNPFYSSIARVVEEVARGHGSLLVTGSSEENPEREQELVRSLLERRVDGLIVVPTPGDHRFLRAEIDLGTPVVFLDRAARGARADTVLLDNEGGARAAAAHLLDRGHKQVAVLADSLSIPTIAERVAGCRAELEERGTGLPDALLALDVHTPAAASEALGRLLDARSAPTAVFAANNRITVGVIEEVHRRGATLDVVGFDDFELSHLVPVPLHVVAYDVHALGRRAAELLFERIGGHTGRARKVVLPTTLVARGTATEARAATATAG